MIQEAASEYVWGVKNPGRVANKYKISVLKKLIKEELKVTLTEQHFDAKTGEPTSERGRELETKMVDQAIDAEKKCFEWAKSDPEKRDELIKHFKLKGKGIPPKILEACPHKADKEAHRRLAKVRDRVTRAERGLPPAKDDTTQIAKVRRRTHRVKQGLPPAADDTTQIAKVRRQRLARSQNK
jgi:hypothetical protein